MSATGNAAIGRWKTLRGWLGAWALALLALPGPADAALQDAWNNAACKTCHGASVSPTLTPILSYLSQPITPNWCAVGQPGNGTTMCNSYSSYISSLTTQEAADIYAYLLGGRDTAVAGGGGVDAMSDFVATDFSTTRTQTVTITNYRSEALEFRPSITLNATDFSVANSSCTLVSASPLTLRVNAATGATTTSPTSCTITASFHPAASLTPSRIGNLRIAFTSYTAPQPRQRDLSLAGTAQFPVYSPSGFAALTSPSFAAATNGSQTMCPIIANPSATTAALSIGLSIGQASGASADYSNYYEIGALTDCSGSGLPALCVPTASSVTGSTSLAAGASCTLPIKFNPGKFGFPGGTGARSAQLTVTHNSPTAGQAVNYTLVGAVTSGPEPRIGITTNPAVVSGQVSPPAFANQVILTASSAWNEFLVSNTGTADGLDITQVLNSNAAEFALTENCVAAAPLAVLSGSGPTCTIVLTFTPSALGQRCTTVTVRAAFSSNGDQAVQVCGTGVPVPVPQMDVAPTGINFGNRSIGAVYLPANVVVTNLPGATLALQIGAVAISGSGFSFVPDATSCQNRSLAAGASCALQVQFTPDPSAPGTSYAANLTIASNDPTTPHRVIPLTGTAVAGAVPVLQWQGVTSPLSFPGLVAAGQASTTTLVARLVSMGPGAVDVQSVRLVGADAASFSASGCPALLYEGEFCDISLRFMPGSGGTKAAQLEVLTVTGVAPTLITVQGQGVGGTSPFVTVSTTALSFGGVRVGARSEPLEVTLAAGGDGVLQVTSISADAPFSVSSTTCPTPPFTLPLGADCRIGVTYTPTGTADNSGKLHILTNNGVSTTEVSLDGVGQPAADVSGGGCTLAGGDPRTDPTLWLLALLAAGVLWKRRNGPKR